MSHGCDGRVGPNLRIVARAIVVVFPGTDSREALMPPERPRDRIKALTDGQCLDRSRAGKCTRSYGGFSHSRQVVSPNAQHSISNRVHLAGTIRRGRNSARMPPIGIIHKLPQGKVSPVCGKSICSLRLPSGCWDLCFFSQRHRLNLALPLICKHSPIFELRAPGFRWSRGPSLLSSVDMQSMKSIMPSMKSRRMRATWGKTRTIHLLLSPGAIRAQYGIPR